MKCPTCHEVYATRAGYDAHVPNCAYQDNPLPEPETEKIEGDGLDNMKANELKAMAEEMGIEGAGKMKKAELIEAIREVRAAQEAAGAGDSE